MTRKGTGIAPVANHSIPPSMAHRPLLTWTNAIVKGGVHNLTAYLRHSQGLSEANLLLLGHAAAALGAVSGPWIAAGDWNMSPETLAQSGWLKVVGGVVFAKTLPTCNASTYDYFVVSKGLEPSVAGIQRIDDAGRHPHWPSRLLIRGDARRPMTRHLIRPMPYKNVMKCKASKKTNFNHVQISILFTT